MTSTEDEGIKEMFWPPSGFLFKEITLSPVFCKPKLIPLKSVTLEKLERMQADALEKLKQMEDEQKQAEQDNQVRNLNAKLSLSPY
jgi:BBSome-interacting protein 1